MLQLCTESVQRSYSLLMIEGAHESILKKQTYIYETIDLQVKQRLVSLIPYLIKDGFHVWWDNTHESDVHFNSRCNCLSVEF